MILVGDKIKLVRKIPEGFNKIGQIFRISHIDNGNITFYLKDTIAGCMSYDEFEKYFEKVKPVVKKPWTDWKSIRSGERSEDGRNIIIQVRENGKKVQVRGGGYKAEATCCAEDTFDFNKGFELARRRWLAKRFCGQVEDFAKSL